MECPCLCVSIGSTENDISFFNIFFYNIGCFKCFKHVCIICKSICSKVCQTDITITPTPSLRINVYPDCILINLNVKYNIMLTTSLKYYLLIIRLDNVGIYLRRLHWQVNKKDKPCPPRNQRGQAVDRAIQMCVQHFTFT